MKTAIAYLCKDRPELIEQSLPPLVAGARQQQYNLFVIDGSDGVEAQMEILRQLQDKDRYFGNVRGGAGAAIVFALTEMLKGDYDYVGLCEADVLLPVGWFDSVFALFSRGLDDGLSVGAVSSRCYEDRVLFQRAGYVVCHNLGAGHILFRREAAELVLKHFRTGWTADNRRIFSQLTGTDIGTFWAFRINEHYTTADWHWDVTLAAHGLASLALTPSLVEMIGQNPPLDQQGLKIVTSAVSERCDDAGFHWFSDRLSALREGKFYVGVDTQFHFDPNTSTWTYFPHQMHMLGGRYEGDWRLKEMRGWGTFAWMAGDRGQQETPSTADVLIYEYPTLYVPVFGSLAVLVSGGKNGGQFSIEDESSGFHAQPDLPPEGEQGQVLQLLVPGGLNYRTLKITALTPGVVFYGLQSREKQPFDPSATFRYSDLPPV